MPQAEAKSKAKAKTLTQTKAKAKTSAEAERENLILEALKKWDLNNNGTIEEDELKHLLVSFGFPPEEAHDVFVAVDANGDGHIDFTEFVEWLYREPVLQKSDEYALLDSFSEATDFEKLEWILTMAAEYGDTTKGGKTNVLKNVTSGNRTAPEMLAIWAPRVAKSLPKAKLEHVKRFKEAFNRAITLVQMLLTKNRAFNRAITEDKKNKREDILRRTGITVVVRVAASGTEMACLRMFPSSDGVRVKTALTEHLKNTEFVQALITEDGQAMEDSMSLAELGANSTVRLGVILGKFQWVGVWKPFFLNDYRVGDYMDSGGNMHIEADGSVCLHMQNGTKEFHFKGDPPHANENFKVLAAHGKRDALEKMAMARQSDGSIRVTHSGNFFSWLRQESAFIDYKLVEPAAEEEEKAPASKDPDHLTCPINAVASLYPTEQS